MSVFALEEGGNRGEEGESATREGGRREGLMETLESDVEGGREREKAQ